LQHKRDCYEHWGLRTCSSIRHSVYSMIIRS
jgi:hypothetical protein